MRIAEPGKPLTARGASSSPRLTRATIPPEGGIGNNAKAAGLRTGNIIFTSSLF